MSDASEIQFETVDSPHRPDVKTGVELVAPSGSRPVLTASSKGRRASATTPTP